MRMTAKRRFFLLFIGVLAFVVLQLGIVKRARPEPVWKIAQLPFGLRPGQYQKGKLSVRTSRMEYSMHESNNPPLHFRLVLTEYLLKLYHRQTFVYGYTNLKWTLNTIVATFDD